MNISCEVIRDLLPLYHDGVCSDDSRELVSAHLKNCDACSRELDLLDKDFSVPHIVPDSEMGLKAASKAWKKAKKKSFVKGLVITAMICAILIGGFFGLTQWKVVPVSADLLEVSGLSLLPDGSIYFHLFVNDNKNLYFTKYTTTDDGSLYVTPMHSVIETTRTTDIGGFSGYHVFNFSVEHGDPQYFGTTYRENITKLYVGPVGKGTLIWEDGMQLDAADSEIAENLFMH